MVVGMIFLAMITLQGFQDQRQAQQIIFMLATISLFSLILRNTWVTLFLLWTVFLYSFFKFTSGSTYLTNVFSGCVLYFITKVAFKKEHIGFFINGFLWFVCANIFYMAIQISGFDFIFHKIEVRLGLPVLSLNTLLRGFMGHAATAGTVIALAIPFLATRGSRWAWAGTIMLFIPLYLCKTSLCMLMGIAGLLFVLYYKIPKRTWIALILILSVSGGFYLRKVDGLGLERFPIWHKVLQDAMVHPVTGWGLDSFANVTPQKQFKYLHSHNNYSLPVDEKKNKYEEVKVLEWWDNPHNLLISIFYEFGFIGLFLLVGYMRQNILRYIRAEKNNNTLALSGFVLIILGISMGHFPLWIAREAVFIIPGFALWEVSLV